MSDNLSARLEATLDVVCGIMIEVNDDMIDGDEIVAVNGVSVQKHARRNIFYTHGATYQARMIRALEAVLEIPHMRFREPAEKLAKLTLRRGEHTFESEHAWVGAHDYRHLKEYYRNVHLGL